MGAVQSVAQDLATGDVFYPDNSNRQARLEQLEADIHRLVNETAQSYDNVAAAARQIDASLARFGIAPTVIPGSDIDAFRKDASLFPLYSVPPVANALTLGSLSLAALGTDGMSPELEALLGSAGLGLFPLMPLPAIAVLNGAERREKLQEGIHGSLPARLKLQEAIEVNAELVTRLASVKASIDSLDDTFDPAQVQAALSSRAAREANDIRNRDFGAQAKQKLDYLDQSRGAWTAEDGNFGAPPPPQTPPLTFAPGAHW